MEVKYFGTEGVYNLLRNNYSWTKQPDETLLGLLKLLANVNSIYTWKLHGRNYDKYELLQYKMLLYFAQHFVYPNQNYNNI